MWEKAVTRRHGNYYPKEVVDEVERELSGITKKRSKEECIKLYIHVRSSFIINLQGVIDACSCSSNT